MNIWLIQRSELTPLDGQGSERLMRTGILAETLVERGHHVTWWTSTFDHYKHRQRFETDTKVDISESYSIQFLKGCGYSSNVSLARLRENHLVARRFRALAPTYASRPDIIVASIPTAELCLAACQFAEKLRIPVILDARDLWPDVFLDIVPPLGRPIARLLSMPMDRRLRQACAMATGITGLTHEFVAWATDKAGRTAGANDRVFAMGYVSTAQDNHPSQEDADFWRRHGIGQDSEDLLAIFFGAMGRVNNLRPIVEAARRAAERRMPIKFVLCGSGEKEAEVRNAASTLDTLVMPGWVRAGQIRALMSVADIGIAPYIDSINFTYNIPNKPAEYFSGALPLALSLSAGPLYDKLMANECGFSYRHDPDLLLSELADLVARPDILSRMKANARALFDREFDGQSVYSEYAAFLESLVASQRPQES